MGVHLGMWGFIPSHSLHSWEHVMWLPGLPLGPQPCNPLALVPSPRLGLRQPLRVALLKGLLLMFDWKNSKTMKCDVHIGWPSHHHVHAHWTKWKHWSFHDSWEKQNHWKFHPTFIWWFMDSIFWTYISKLIRELTLNPLLLLHHVMHIPKYSLFELR